MAQVGYLGEERVVTARRLRAAFDDMAGNHCAGESVVIAASPAEVCSRRADHHRGIGHPSGDHDVGTGVQAFDDAPGAQIGVGCQGRVHAEPKFGGSGQQIVTFDVGNCQGDGQPLGERPNRCRQAARIQSASVDDDPHSAILSGS